MTTNECKHSYGEDSIVNANDNYSNPDYNAKGGSDPEIGPSKTKSPVLKTDPFGDETNSEVKYKSMAWWLVTYPKCQS